MTAATVLPVATPFSRPASPVSPGRVPPLENGARLTRAEFHRRYLASPHVRRAELIEGVAYIMSFPLSLSHGTPHGLVMLWLGTYAVRTPGVEATDNVTYELDNDNEPQPDACLRILSPAAGARARETPEGYLTGAPELIVEVAATSASLDMGDKKRAYRRNGVQEYLVWRTLEQRLDWWELVDGDYQPLPVTPDGIIESRVFPGLRLAMEALLVHRMADVLDDLQANGIGSPAHRAFVERLRTAAG